MHKAEQFGALHPGIISLPGGYVKNITAANRLQYFIRHGTMTLRRRKIVIAAM